MEKKEDMFAFYDKLGEDMIKIIAKTAIKEYYVYLKSEEIATEIMNSYGKKYSKKFGGRAKLYESLIDYVNARSIDVEYDECQVKPIDVVNRLDEQMLIEINDLENNVEELIQLASLNGITDRYKIILKDIYDEYDLMKEAYLEQYGLSNDKRKKLTID